jgi:hypothetical protein
MILPEERAMFEREEDKAYEEYNKIIGGDPIGLEIPNGYPEGVEERGGVIAVYNECIKKGVKWEKLLNVPVPPEDAEL